MSALAPGLGGRARSTWAPARAPGPATSLRGAAWAGAGALALLVVALGGWAATTVIGGAVIAGGRVVVEGRAKEVQHQDGGTVAVIAVRNGDRVAAGDLLVALDPTLVALNLDIARTRLAAALADRARLLAEQAGAPAVDFALPELPVAVLAPPLETAPHEASQREIFAARAETLAGGRARLAETLRQFDSQIDGLRGQIEAVDDQIASLDADIASQQRLVDEGLARQSELSGLLRARAGLAGERSSHRAEVARIEVAKRDAELATLQEERSFREEVVTKLREAEDTIEELTLEIVTRRAQLDRMEIRAPAAGIVHEMQVTTVGGVVAPGGTVLDIVPQDGEAQIEVEVDPRSIDQVHPGQPAEIVLPGLDPQGTPRLEARVATVSADAITDPQTRRAFYRVDLDLAPGEIERLGDGVALVPGMPVEAYLETGDRTVLGYLLEPLAGRLRQAFRE